MRAKCALQVSVLLAFLLPPLALAAAPAPGAEAWLLYEQGKARMEAPAGAELGEALLLFSQAIEKRGGEFPEAEVAVGDVYKAEGAYALAKQQYEKALGHAQGFDVPQQRYEVLYRLTDLAELQNPPQYGEMERSLMRVLADQSYYASPQHAGLRDAMRKAYLAQGLDQMLRLYRFEQSAFALEAHGRLGWLLYRTGRFDSGPQGAVTNLLFAVDIAVTEIVDELRRLDPEYVYSTLPDMLSRTTGRDYLVSYVRDSRLIENLYYLASATWAGGEYLTRAASLWHLLADGTLDPGLVGEFADKARRQLQSPKVEPYLNTSARSIQYTKP